MDLQLAGRIALVTGGMSGIGRTIVEVLCDEGCEVYVGDLEVGMRSDESSKRDAPGDGGTSDRASASRAMHSIKLDVGDAEGVARVVHEIVRAHARIDILVNCAGILKTRPLVESTIADWDDVARVNLSGVYYCSKAVMAPMIDKRYGKIINIASVSSAKGGGQFGNVLYGTTKAGVVAMTQGFARELGRYGINVNAVSPGVVETAMTASLMTPEMRERVTESIPLGRLVQPIEVARVVAYLASDVSSAITGQAIVVDRGFLVR